MSVNDKFDMTENGLGQANTEEEISVHIQPKRGSILKPIGNSRSSSSSLYCGTLSPLSQMWDNSHVHNIHRVQQLRIFFSSLINLHYY